MSAQTKVRSLAADLLAQFAALGAQEIETTLLQPADLLLDLYGEDIRSRAYVTQDPLRGEQMLRPDFTVPVVLNHMEHGATPARYTYAGTVFRRQEEFPERSREYPQVGFEVFDTGDPARSDAEVFTAIAAALPQQGLRAAVGDIGLLRAAVTGLQTTDARKAALLRHLWRPHRFRSLLERFSHPLPPADTGTDNAPWIGLRSQAEMTARLADLEQERATPPLSSTTRELFAALLNVRETAPNALSQLRDLAVDLPAISPAVAALSARLDAMAARGVDLDALDFEGSYGRTAMEYYDGFVFGFYVEGRPDLQPIATGGRYDALTAALGRGASIPAVGGMIRPDLLLAFQEARA